MAYIRKRGNQLALVHGRREGGAGKVDQVNLFTLYSQEEAKAAFQNPDADTAVRFRSLLEDSFPQIKFDWGKIREEAMKHLDVLPPTYANREAAIFDRLPGDFAAFGRQICLADPTDVPVAAEYLQQHRLALLGLCSLVRLQLSRLNERMKRHFAEDEFRWSFSAGAREVPNDIQEHVEELYEEGRTDEAERIFSLLVECFPGHAEGYYYLGHIAMDRGRINGAIVFFQKTVETGRWLFPKRLPKEHMGKDLKSRPFIRGLQSLAMALNCAGKYEEALAICRRMEKECGDELNAISQRARIYLNLRDWERAAEAAVMVGHNEPDTSLVAALALLEMGKKKESLPWLLHGALNLPHTAKVLAGLPDSTLEDPDDVFENRDRQEDFYLRRDLRRYLKGRVLKSRSFFREVISNSKVQALLDEVVRLRRTEGGHENNGSSPRGLLLRMQSLEFAREKAVELQGGFE